MLLMIDNYDSFTFNLVHYFQALGQEVVVYRNDEISLQEIEKMAPHFIVISPGPCDPDSAGISLAVVKHFSGKIPLLGVCLGHQCIAQYFGAIVEKARKVMHGKTSLITHNNQGLFSGLPKPLEVTRYHSLIVNKASLPECLEISAWTVKDEKLVVTDTLNQVEEIMALQHKNLPICSVQFHPESVLTEQGQNLLANFIKKYQDYPIA
ncbi:aminodeoxychorismate/anthranilate synthase component II [Colwellia asteriadis]